MVKLSSKSIEKDWEDEPTEAAEEFGREEEEYMTEGKPFFRRIVDFVSGGSEEEEMEEEAAADEDEKQPVTGQRKGFLSSIKGWFSGDEEPVEDNEYAAEKVPEVTDDIKNILKIQNKWLGRLHPEIIKEFKNSDDYQTYKDTLKRYNLIKVKGGD